MLLAESFLHTLDPFAIELLPGVGVRWYGLAYAVGFVVGWVVIRSLAARRLTHLAPGQAGDLLTYLVFGVIAGGRVGHVVFYDPHLLWTFDSSFPWWGLLAIHRGGMASHGGVIGVILAAWLFSRRSGVRMLEICDVTALACTTGLGLGRLANLVNGELWGKALPPPMQASPPWWSIKYPVEALDPAFPNAEALEPLRLLVDPTRPFPQSVVDAAMLGRESVVEALTPLLTAHYPSQVFQAITDGVILPLVLVAVWWKLRPIGTLGGSFLLAYGLLRIATEQFREPDEGVLAIGWWSSGPGVGATLPMLLSGAMILAGVGVILGASRGGMPRIGGFGVAEAQRLPEPS
jgi:phosphatidylglycerol:prolipoprotein diacylglycerol transferase